jgi:hypothetical protein
VKDFIAPITAMGMIFGGGIFLFLTLGIEGARVESSHLVVSGLMGGAAQYLFGADIQQRANSSVPTITTTAGPPPVTTVSPPMSPAQRESYDNGDFR